MKSKQSVRAEQLSQGSQVPSSIVLQARTYIEQCGGLSLDSSTV